MGLTPVYSWPYPDLNSRPDGATQMKNMALAIETTVNALAKPPLCQVRHTVAQSLASSAFVPLNFDVEAVDTANMHSNSTNPNRITATYSGWYRLSGAISFAVNGTGRRLSSWAVNGVPTEEGALCWVTSSPTYSVTIPAPDVVVRLNVNDYVELRAFQDSGGTLNTATAGQGRPWACVQYVTA